MEELRNAARESLRRRDSHAIPDSLLDNIAIPEGLDLLSQYISSHGDADDLTVCENLLIAQQFLKIRRTNFFSESDESAANYIYDWASRVALPSPVFAEVEVESSDEKKDDAIRDSRLRSTLAVSVLTSLATLLPIQKASNASDIVIALASFTSEQDPWTTKESYTASTAVLQSFFLTSRAVSDALPWSIIERILKERIRPLFTKTKNPAITAGGRKNFHPVPLPRFDASIMNPEAKPWKINDVYATTVFTWVIAQYQSTDRSYLEKHFPFLVPPVLTLIDDDSLTYKTRGCILLSRLLKPIRESKSDILQRTNLSSVFEDAVRPCLLSLPTITPEDDAIQLLGVAYPALQSLLKTAYQNSLPSTGTKPSTTHKETYISSVAKTLRSNLIPSFHHISSTNTTSTTSFASFHYPRLSTLLVDQMYPLLFELGIHTTKYFQEIVPLLYSTLTNPFGTAHPPLLLSAVAVIRAVILNAHPRLWRWRGEILGGLCSCWLHALEEEDEITERARKGQNSDLDQTTGVTMTKLKKELKGAVYLLKFALENPVQADGDSGQLEAKGNIKGELQELINAEDSLRDLLTADIDPNDADLFGLDP